MTQQTRGGAVLTRRSDGTLEATTARARLTVDPADGGRMTSLVIDGVEVLGSSTRNPGMPSEFFHGAFLMAPFVGRTRHGRFTHEGVAHQLPRNVGEHAMHGLVYDLGWTATADGVETAFDSRWPLGGGVRQRFELTDDGLTVTAEVFNEERSMPAAVGFHPWFLDELSTGERATFDFEPSERLVCDDDGIPVDIVPGGGPRPWDDTFRGVTREPFIRWGDRLQLTIGSDHEYWIVCETMPNSFCIEPLTGPVNALADGSATIVSPGAPLRLRMTLRWERPTRPRTTTTGTQR